MADAETTFAQQEAPLVLALDIGSSSIRCRAYDALGRAVSGLDAGAPTAVESKPGGVSEADPDVLLAAAFACLDVVVDMAGQSGAEIAGVGVCTFVANLMGLDAGGRPTTRLSTYADTSSLAQADQLKAELDEEAARQRTGCRLHPSYLPPRLLRIREQAPDVFSRTVHWLTIGEYLEKTLFGETAATVSAASWSGLLDRRALEWDKELLSFLGVSREKLSPLTDAGAPRSGLAPEYARRWPALAHVPWFPAVGDGAAANIGCGCVGPDRAALTMGTSSAVRAVVPGPLDTIPKGLWCYLVDRNRLLPGGALSEGGCVYAWLRQTLRLDHGPDFERALDAMPPDGHGLTALPLFAGERAPGWSGKTGAAFVGMNLSTTSLDMARAAMESVALRLALTFDCLRPLLPDNAAVVAGGGVPEASPAWTRIMADALGVDIVLPNVKEISARGAALLALESLGALSDMAATAPDPARVFHPNERRHKIYQRAMERQQELYGALIKGSKR